MENQLQKRRYYEVDLARAVPLLFLPIVHCYEEFAALEMLTPTALSVGKIWLYLCAFGPSIFMMVLGMNISFSSHTSPRELLRRGVITMGLFVGLNLVRNTIPAFLGYLAVPDPEVIEMGICVLLQSDILMFAGISFCFFALMKKLGVKPLWIVLFTSLLLALSMTFTLDMPLTIWTGLLGNFVRTNEVSSFPAMSWLIYPAIGYLIGEELQKQPEEAARRRFYHTLMGIGATMVAVTSLALYGYGYNPLTIAAAVVRGNVTDVFNVLLDAGLGFFWMGIFYELWGCIRSQKIKNIAVAFSKAIIVFYIIQWIFVGWGEVILGAFFWKKECLGIGVVVLCSVVIAVASLALALPIQKKRELAKASRRGEA